MNLARAVEHVSCNPLQKNNLENEQRNKLTPSQEKEKLMKQVKNDNDM